MAGFSATNAVSSQNRYTIHAPRSIPSRFCTPLLYAYFLYPSSHAGMLTPGSLDTSTLITTRYSRGLSVHPCLNPFATSSTLLPVCHLHFYTLLRLSIDTISVDVVRLLLGANLAHSCKRCGTRWNGRVTYLILVHVAILMHLSTYSVLGISRHY